MDAVHWRFCLFASCAWHHLHLCISARIPDPWATYSKQLTGHEFYIVCAGRNSVRPPGGGGGGVTWRPPPWDAGNCCPGGGGGWTWGGGGYVCCPPPRRMLHCLHWAVPDIIRMWLQWLC